jgi:quercetin dioxygenase-like cupin family protein
MIGSGSDWFSLKVVPLTQVCFKMDGETGRRDAGGGNSLTRSYLRPTLRTATDFITMKNEIIRIGQLGIKFLLEAADTNGSVAMFEFTVPVGAKVPIPHSHKHYDETIYGVEGTLTFTVDGKTVHIPPGESYFIPRGTVRGFDNLKQTDAKALAVVTPALISPDFFKESAAIVNAGGPPDMEKLKVVFARHGLVPAMPQM